MQTSPSIQNLDPESLNLTPGAAGQLTGALQIAGVPFCVEFIRVNTRTGNVAMHANRELQTRIDAIRSFDHGKNYQTVRYRGREYFVLVVPKQA